MLVIREPQWRELRARARDAFLEKMVERLRVHFPAQIDAMGKAAALQHVDAGVELARGFGLVSQRDVCKYLNLTMVHGLHFDRDPERAWMRTMITDPQVPVPSERLARLYAESIRRLRVEAKNERIRQEFGL